MTPKPWLKSWLALWVPNSLIIASDYSPTKMLSCCMAPLLRSSSNESSWARRNGPMKKFKILRITCKSQETKSPNKRQLRMTNLQTRGSKIKLWCSTKLLNLVLGVKRTVTAFLNRKLFHSKIGISSWPRKKKKIKELSGKNASTGKSMKKQKLRKLKSVKNERDSRGCSWSWIICLCLRLRVWTRTCSSSKILQETL